MTAPLWHSLLTRVLRPLVSGAELHLLRPIGTKRALEQAELAAQASCDMLEGVCELRVRRARQLCPIQELSPPARAEWLLAAALNDLLVATHPRLKSWLSATRARTLLGLVRSTIEHAGPPADVREALARHASFGNVFGLERRDTVVSFWAGSHTFIGEKPAPRYLLWPELRRVTSSEQRVPLHELRPKDEPEQSLFLDVLKTWICASPLTDLAELARKQPAFSWSGSSLGLIATPLGRTLALRAIEWNGNAREAAVQARAAALRIPQELAQARALALEFADEISLRAARLLNDSEAPAARVSAAPQSLAAVSRRPSTAP